MSNSADQSEDSLVIAFHANGNTAGGLAAFIRHLVRSFRKQGHRIVLLVNRPGPFSEEMSETCEVYSFDVDTIVNPGFNLGPLRIPDPIAAIKNCLSSSMHRKRVSKILQQANPDAVLGNGMFSAALIGSSCRQLKIPLILAIHGIGRRSNDPMSLRARIAARMLNQATTVVGVSKACLERYSRFLRVPTMTIYNSCPPIQTQNLKPDFLRENGLPADTLIVGSFGRITRDKGYHVLIRAVAQLEKSESPAIVIGGKPLTADETTYLGELQQLVDSLEMKDRCLFIGEVTPERFFSIIDIFCHTYLGEENLSYAILEAMSACCPVIAVDLGGPKEMIDAPTSGQLIAPNNSELLAEAILKYIEDPEYAKSAAEHGLERSRTIFNFNEWPNQWLNLIESCHQHNPS